MRGPLGPGRGAPEPEAHAVRTLSGCHPAERLRHEAARKVAVDRPLEVVAGGVLKREAARPVLREHAAQHSRREDEQS